MLLRYSIKLEREKNLAKFRMASGLGGMLTPLIGAGMYTIGGFSAIYFTMGAVMLLIAPFIYKRVSAAKEKWDKLK